MTNNENPPNLDQFLLELNDPDPLVRQEAAIALGDFCREDHPCIDVSIERLQSTEQTHHDRACAVWALGRIKAKAGEVVPILLTLIDEMKDQLEADEFRSYAAEAIERLTGDIDVLTTVAKSCLGDGFWKSRMRGLSLVERLFKRQPDLRDAFVPLIEPLLRDELEEIRENVRRILAGLEEGV